MLRASQPSSSGAGRRRSPNAPQICAVLTALLLLLSLTVLHSRLSSSSSPFPLSLPFHKSPSKLQDYPSTLFDDADNDAFDGTPDDDRIDVLDLDDSNPKHPADNDDEPESDEDPQLNSKPEPSALFWDHVLAVHRRSFGKPDPNTNTNTDPDPDSDPAQMTMNKVAFSSDDQPLDEKIRSKLHSIKRIEEVLMIKTAGSDNPLRDGWVGWLEGKGDFLRRDKMLRSNLELLNPKNHPLLQDPDVVGLSSYTKGDKLVQKSILKEMEKVPFPFPSRDVRVRRSLQLEKKDDDGRRWGYFPGIDEKGHLSFSEFVERFFKVGRCGIRVFMVWNSPSWMFGVRHQRGLESVLKVHRDACVVVLSEMMEMDFFESFVKDGFKIAVAMPDLDELLKDTPTREFSSLWYEWRQTKHYPVHYSELVRLAALYKFGGVYLDSDIIILKPLYALKNSVGIENQMGVSPVFNGAVMAFDKDSPFLMKCLEEFYSTYDDGRLRWNGADLLTRVINGLNDKGHKSLGHIGVKTESPFSFFPISSSNITRYFAATADEIGRSEEETLFVKILNESTAFHFWNSLTSALVPEPGSLVERLLNHNCLRCRDVF